MELIDLVNTVITFISQNDLSQIVTWILDCDSHNPSLLDLFVSSDVSICSTMDFLPLGNSDVVVSISIDFASNSKQDAPFQCIAYDYSRADGIVFMIT